MEDKLLPLDLKEKYGGKVPYDAYFPTQQQLVEKRFCSVCGMYFSSVKSLTKHHRKICKMPRKRRTAAKKLAPPAKKTAVSKLAPSTKKAAGSKQAPGRTAVSKLAPPAKQPAALRHRKDSTVANEYIDGNTSEGSSEDEELIVDNTEDDVEISEIESDDDLEVNASFIDDENDQDAENNEEVNLEPTVSFQSEGGFEIILDLKQWLKSPWNPVTED